MNTQQIYAVIMAGGTGSGLWPLSRKQYPKQFISLLGDDTMLQKTWKLAADLLPPEQIFVLTGEEYRFIVENQLQHLMPDPARQIILEEESRGTGPAINRAVRHLAALPGVKPEQHLVFLPCDHSQPADNSLLQAVFSTPVMEQICLFGIKPQPPLSDLGYIEISATGKNNTAAVKQLLRPGSRETAAGISARESVFVNLGIFSGSLARFSESTAELPLETPEEKSLSFEDLLNAGEQLSCCCRILDTCWGDLGNWETVNSNLARDSDNNAVRGDVALLETRNSLAFSQKRLLALCGVENIIAVSTPDAVLVTTRDNATRVPELVQQLKQQQRPEVIENITTHRPWGSYTVLEEGERYKIKRITVNCGARLSLQRHMHRSEHWVVVSGTAKVEIGDKTSFVHENESVFVPKSVVHRLSNPGKTIVEIIEVQNGEYLGEDDIERLEDNYGRIN